MAAKIDNVKNEVTLYLRDYLSPGGVYPYAKLTEHLQEFYNAGYEVHLLSVPGFLMVSGYPPRDGRKGYFYSKNKSHKTAAAAISAMY